MACNSAHLGALATGTIVCTILGTLVGLSRPAEACGPEFPTQLLSQRNSTLLELHDGVFMLEATQLVEPPTRPYTVKPGSDRDDPEAVAARASGSERERALYERGANAFDAGDRRAAERAFRALLELPTELRQRRSTWAAYMLGRTLSGHEAIAAYEQVRALVDQGFADDLGLAASSLGQEARLHWYAGDTATAVRRYAEQAAHGHPDGPTSLLFMVRDVVARTAESELIGDAVGQRLLATYLYTRSSELTEPVRLRVWRALADSSMAVGADRMAALAYREGRWALAQKMAERDSRAILSRWVLGKLALRDGDTARAESYLAQAVAGLAERADSCEVSAEVMAPTLDRMSGERAAVALAEGRVRDAMDHAWQARARHPDAMYVAERILTIDELQAFVDQLAGQPAPDNAHDDDNWWRVNDETVRGILARRLMRAGRYDAARAYFAEPERAPARAFAEAMTRAEAASDPIERARALYAASQVARQHGLEILGTAHAPDWGFYGAQFDLSEWQPMDIEARFLSDAEIRRRTASAPDSARRYHYRHVASKLAERAADALPRRSQAFAAALCQSTRYVFHTDRERVRALWRRYVKEGPSVPFAGSFGQRCPEPEFERARRYLPAPQTQPSWSLWIALSLLFVGLVPAIWLLARRVARSESAAVYPMP